MVRASDFGSNDRTFFVKTHLGQVLHPGDTALGYDLSTANLVDPELERCVNKGMTVPDVVLVRSPCCGLTAKAFLSFAIFAECIVLGQCAGMPHAQSRQTQGLISRC